jgi:hypothetical protein
VRERKDRGRQRERKEQIGSRMTQGQGSTGGVVLQSSNFLRERQQGGRREGKVEEKEA